MVTIHRRLITHPGASVLNAVDLGSEALETVKVFNIIPLFSKEGLGDNTAYLRSVTVLFSTR